MRVKKKEKQEKKKGKRKFKEKQRNQKTYKYFCVSGIRRKIKYTYYYEII